jgi:formylglycine-generating enzyme required for sulfatase activity
LREAETALAQGRLPEAFAHSQNAAKAGLATRRLEAFRVRLRAEMARRAEPALREAEQLAAGGQFEFARQRLDQARKSGADPERARQVEAAIAAAEAKAVDPAARQCKPGGAWRAGCVFRDCERCPEMVVVPAGTFLLGSPADEPGRRDDEGPQVRIAIPRPFAIGRHEVTRGQFAAFVRTVGHDASGECERYHSAAKQQVPIPGTDWRRPGFEQTDDHPVVCVTWRDAIAYVAFLASVTRLEYRLPSEAQWEYAARAGGTGAYPWGDEAGRNLANCGFCETAWSRQGTAPVGSFAPNAFGLHDVIGNAAEWVQDCYDDDYAATPPDGGMRPDRSCDVRTNRIARGGSWSSARVHARTAYRSVLPQSRRSPMIGFRVWRTLR